MRRFFRSDFRPVWGEVRRARVRLSRKEGQSLYEFALVLPLLSMLLVGIIFGGITFYDYLTLANAVAVGARTLALSRGVSAPCTTAQTALTNAAVNLNTSLITIAAPTFTGTGGSCCAGTTCATGGALGMGDAGTMSATYPCTLTIPFTGINLCPMKGTGTGTACPYTYCIMSTTTVLIE